MATPNRAAYLTALLNQKKQNEYQGGNVVNQGSSEQISEMGSQSHTDGKNLFQKAMGGIDNIGYRMGKGLFSFLEGFADLGANAIGALGDVTGWYDSKPYTDWAKHDMSDQAMKWAMTYGDMNPISIGKKAVDGKYVDGDYWGNLWGDLGNIFTGQDDGKFEEDFKKNYQYDFDDNFMTNNAVGKFVGGMAESFGRMVPSIALGRFAGGIAEKAALKAGNIIGAAEKAEKVGKLVSTAMIGASSAGSSSVEALNDGANAGQAILYGLASGAVEAGTEYIPWEIVPGLGKLIGKNTLPGIGLRKLSISELGKSMAQEGLEEVVSGVFNPILKTIYKGADSLKEFGNKDFYIDLGKSFASGALMGGLMEGVSMKANSSKYSNEGIDYINKGTEWYDEYMKEVDAFSKLDGRYANGEINSIQYEEGCEEIAGRLKEISQKGEEIGKLWDKIPEGKKDAVREFFSDPQKYAEEMRETTNRVEMDSNKPIGNVGVVKWQTQAQPSNNMAYNAQNVANDMQNQGGVENGQTQSYNGSYEDDFRAIQKGSRENLARDRGDKIYAKDNEGLRERLSETLGRRVESEVRRTGNGELLNLKSEKNGTEFDMYKGVDGQLFHDVFDVARGYTKNGELVDLHEAANYSKNTNYISADGLSGFSITPDGDLISVFNAGNKKGFLYSISDIVKKDAKTLDCYDSNIQDLGKIYEKVFGFKVASEMDYNMEYDHDNIAMNHGNPNVSFMVNTDADVETKHFSKDDYDAAKAYQMSFADNEQNDLHKPIISKLDTLDDNFIKLYHLEDETIASTKQDVINFYNGSIDGTIKDGRLIFGRISETNANDIKNATNIDVKGYSVTLDSSYIKYIDTRHIQNSANRIPLAVDDLSLIPTIISDYDSIESKIFDNGEKQLIFKKKIGNEYLVATMVSNRKKRLIVQFLYITKKESAGTQPRHVSFEALRSTSETRTGDTDSSTNNVNENGTTINTDAVDERTKAYRKAEETYQSNQQLLKDAAPNKKVNLKTATDYANAEASLVESYLNSNVDSDISVKFSSRGEQGKRYSAGVDTSLNRDSAISTLDAQFDDSLKNATVKQRGGEAQKLTDFVDSETLDEIRGIAHSLHEQLVDGADDSKTAKTREMFERKTAYLRERLSNTIDMAKEVDRFNKNAELTKRQFKIDQSKYADESAADGTIRHIAKSLPRYNILLKDGRRISDNSGLSLAKRSYAKWANDAYATLKGIYDNGQLVNFDAERADALFGDLDLIANGGDPNSKSMTLEQVKAMTRVMKALRFQISDQANKKRVELRSRATSLNSEVSYMNEALGKDPGKANGRIRAFANEQVKLSNAGDILMGYDGSGLQKEMDAVVESKWKYYDDYYAMKEKYLPEKSAEIKSLTKELSSKVTINGEKVTKGEVLDAYLMLSDTETKSLMDNARKTDTRKIRIGKATMAYDPSSTYEELGKILGDDLIERGKKVFTSFYNDHSENSYLNKLRDYQLKTSGDTTVSDNKTDYYPRGQASESTTRTSSIEALEKNASGITAKNGNVTKSRQAAQAMVVLEAADPFTRMQDYMSQVSSEMNLRNQSNDFLRLLGLNVTGEDGKTTRLQSSLGAEGTRMLRDFITAANGNELVRSDALLTKMQALSVNATLGFSPINPMKNFLSLFKEGHEVGFSNVMKVIANPTKWVNKELIGAIKNTGVWKARYDDVASMAANADLKGKIGKIGQKMTALYSTFDQATSLMVAQVDLEYVKSAHPEMSTSEQIKEAVRLWQTDVNKTQSTAEKMSKSQSSLGRFMGGDSQIAKGLWTFQSDTVAGASMLVKDISQFQSSSKLIKWAKGVIANANASEAKVSYAKDVLTKATATRNAIVKRRLPAGVAATLIGACLKYLIEDLSQRVRGKKKWDERPIDGDTVVDVLNNGLGSIVPFYETIMSAMKYNDGKVELYGLSALSSLLKGLGEFGKGTPRTALIDTVTAASSLAGIPLKNIYDYTVGAFSSFDPKLAVDTKNILYASEKASTSYKSNFDMALYERVGDVSDDVKVELRTLSDSGYDIKPSGVATTYKNDKGDDVTISWTSKQEMRKYYQKANAKLAKTVKTDYYRSLSDEEKAQAIKKLYSSYREASLAKVVTKKAPTNASSALAYANYKDLGMLLSAVAHISSLEATKTMSRKQRAIAYVNSLKGLSKAQRMAILQMAGYTVDSKYLGQLLRESGMDNKTIKEVTSSK